MKERPPGFLEGEGEVYDYVRELHEYLWRFIRAASPGAGGLLDDLVDAAVEQAEEARFHYSEWEPKAKGCLGAIRLLRIELAETHKARWYAEYNLAAEKIEHYIRQVKERSWESEHGKDWPKP